MVVLVMKRTLLTNDTGSSAVFSVNEEYDSLTNSDDTTYGSGYKVVATFGTAYIHYEDGDAAHSGSSGSDQDVFIYEGIGCRWYVSTDTDYLSSGYDGSHVCYLMKDTDH